MYFFKKNKSRLLIIIGFFFILQTALWASDSYLEMKDSLSPVKASELISEKPMSTSTTPTEISLDFGVGSMSIVLVLTSLLGLFFVRDELSVL